MKEELLKELLDQYLTGSITEKEKLELTRLIEQSEYREKLELLMEETFRSDVYMIEENPKLRNEIQDWLKEKMENSNVVNISDHRSDTKVKKLPFLRYAAAAIIIFMAIGTYFVINNGADVKPVAQKQTKTDVLPGHNGAILTLADGSRIVLDNAHDGKLTDVAVKNGNKVSYQNSDQTKVEYNTMTTPKGRQFSLVLPDGTQVWLNAASSITYPTAFAGNERKVSITGEAYFEVTHDAKKPFHVNVNGMDVQVLGTHFNINSYADEEAIKTTLLQGSIKISVAGKTQLVKPGQQTQVTNDNQIKLLNDADMDHVMAWKNGYFSFKDADIRTVMRQLSRWYDIEVVFSGVEPKQQFNGEIGRNLTLKEVLDGLAFTSQHFKIEDGKKLIILPGKV